MRLISFRREEGTSFGAVVEGRIVDLGLHLPEFHSLRELLQADALVRALDAAAEISPDYRLDRVTTLPPLTNPDRLLCVFDESRNEAVNIDPKFVRGNDQPLLLPAGDSRPLAAGVALVAGGKDGGGGQIAGASLISYLSPGSLAMGPWLVTADELQTTDQFTFTVEVEDQTTEISLSALDGLRESLSRSHELNGGDVLAVLRYLPDMKVSAGNRIQVCSGILGELGNPIEAEAPDNEPADSEGE